MVALTLNPAPGWQKQMDLCEFKVSLVNSTFQTSLSYIERPCLTKTDKKLIHIRDNLNIKS